jgi:hypothetical protein
MDFVELGTTGKQPIFTDVGITATGTFPASGNAPFKVVTGNTPSTTLQFQAFPTTQGVLLLSWQQGQTNSRVTVGVVSAQQ